MNICIRIKRARGQILLELLPFVFLNAFCLCIDSACGGNQLVPQLLMKQSDTLLTQYRNIEHLCEE